MNIPMISKISFFKLEANLGNVWDAYFNDQIKLAGIAEKEIAIQAGKVDNFGIPCISVIVDGGWSKRSYGYSFNANSGVVCS